MRHQRKGEPAHDPNSAMAGPNSAKTRFGWVVWARSDPVDRVRPLNHGSRKHARGPINQSKPQKGRGQSIHAIDSSARRAAGFDTMREAPRSP